MDDQTARHHLFQTARRRAGWNFQQLWVAYLSVGGTADAFDIEAFLHGIGPLTPAQQDVLAAAVNDRLHDIYLGAQVPYLFQNEDSADPVPEILTALDDLLRQRRRERDD